MKLATIAALLLPSVAAAQHSCGGTDHYRWKEKVETAGSRSGAKVVKISDIVENWPHPDITKKTADFCIARETDEQKQYVVIANVWRVKLSPDDSDYHLELTDTSTKAFTPKCMVAEIPLQKWGSGYGTLRSLLEGYVGGPVTGTKDFTKPLQLKITGVAFWDGWHAGKTKPNNHGRCNAAGIGVWELHPITAMSRVKGASH
jgi:hypothetical protein